MQAIEMSSVGKCFESFVGLDAILDDSPVQELKTYNLIQLLLFQFYLDIMPLKPDVPNLLP